MAKKASAEIYRWQRSKEKRLLWGRFDRTRPDARAARGQQSRRRCNHLCSSSPPISPPIGCDCKPRLSDRFRSVLG